MTSRHQRAPQSLQWMTAWCSKRRYYFYSGTYTLEIKPPQFIARYGEIARVTEVKVGDQVKDGQVIAYVGERGHRMVVRNGSLPERTAVSVGHPKGNRAVGDRAKVVETNDVSIFCPDHRNHAMLHEAIRCAVGEPGFGIGLHRFLAVFRKSVDGQVTELAARKISQARVAGLDGVNRRAGKQDTRMSPQKRFVRGLGRQFFKRKRFDGITRFAMGLPQNESRRGQPHVKRVR